MSSEDIIIHPRKGKKEKSLPSFGLMLANPVDANFAHELLLEGGGSKRFLYNSSLTVAADTTKFVAGPAVGAPMAVLTLEKLIALGVEKLILFGWCGAVDKGVKIGDVLIGETVVVGEGTSRYYPVTDQVKPSNSLNLQLSNALQERGVSAVGGGIWSTDAPYREDRTELFKLHNKFGINAVDMEYSALCTVSCFRTIEFSALFLVSDELYGKGWNPGFSKKPFNDKRKMLIKLLLDMSL